MECFRSLKGTPSENDREQGVEVDERASMVHTWPLAAACCGLALDAFASGALGGDGRRAWAGTIPEDTGASPRLVVALFVASFPLENVVVIAAVTSDLGEEKRTARASSARASGLGRVERGKQAQSCGTAWHAIGIDEGCALSMERDSRDPAMTSRRIGDRPGIRGSVSREMRGRRVKGDGGLVRQGTDGCPIAFVEGLGLCSQDDIAIIGSGRSGDARAVAPKECFLFL